MSGHYKVVSAGNVYGRVAIDPNDKDGDSKARAKAVHISEMHKNHKGDKGPNSPSASANYTVEFDPAEYPTGAMPEEVLMAVRMIERDRKRFPALYG